MEAAASTSTSTPWFGQNIQASPPKRDRGACPAARRGTLTSDQSSREHRELDTAEEDKRADARVGPEVGHGEADHVGGK
jgi:hypothetical protein